MTESTQRALAASQSGEQVLLRPMTAQDVDVLLPFEQQMFGAEAWSRRSYLEEIADTELRYYLVAATPDGRLLGNAGLLTIAETAQVLTVGVLPAARRRGIGRLLVRALVTEARRRQCDEVLLEVRMDNKAARSLYAAEGFQHLGVRRGYYDRGRMDAVTMRMPIPRAARDET